MKRFFTLVLIPGLVMGPQIQAGNADSGGFLFFNSAADEQCQVVEECPVADPVVNCEVAPRTVRRVVPRTTYKAVTRTIMVPETYAETRQVQSVEYRDEVRERAHTVYDQVPETKHITTQHTVMVPETRERLESFTVQVPFEREVAQAYTVNRLQTETRTGTRDICRCIPKTETRTVITGGEIQKRTVESPNGGVKVQSVVVGGCKKQEAVTVMRKQTVRQTYQYNVQVSRPETQTRMVKQLDYRNEARTRTVADVVQVPKLESRTHAVTEMRSVPRQKIETFTERVPHVVTKEIQVPATRMVAKQVVDQVPVTTYDVIEEPVSDCENCNAPIELRP